MTKDYVLVTKYPSKSAFLLYTLYFLLIKPPNPQSALPIHYDLGFLFLCNYL